MGPLQQYFTRGPGSFNLIIATQFKWAPLQIIFKWLSIEMAPQNNIDCGSFQFNFFQFNFSNEFKWAPTIMLKWPPI